MISVCVKSGTNGYSDYDNCDMVIKEFDSPNVPHVGDFLTIKNVKYLVREVNRIYGDVPQSDNVREYVYVYVINA